MGFVVDTATLVLAAAEPADEGLNPLVKPLPGLMIWTLLSFGVALFILAKFVFPKITSILDERQRQIEASIETAKETRAEADAILSEYRQRLADARQQAEDILTRARAAGEQAEADSLERARRQRDELMAQTKRDIDAETRRAIQDIRREVADLTIAATEKVTRRSLSDEDQQRLVEEALSELDFTALSGADRGRG